MKLREAWRFGDVSYKTNYVRPEQRYQNFAQGCSQHNRLTAVGKDEHGEGEQS